MLAVSPLRRNERETDMEAFSITDGNGFPDFNTGNLLDSIDFDDLFVGISDGDSLPDLEMDPEILAEFSSHVMGDELDMSGISSPSAEKSDLEEKYTNNSNSNNTTSGSTKAGDDEKGSASSGTSSLIQGDEQIVRKKDSSTKGKKSSAHSKNPPGKKKVKVDWTPELHRRFVQAVEQLGVDKAVPSRILELMGIDCLTRHNIASHLQKYRSHRKHLLAREAEAANWSQRRHGYGGATTGGVIPGKREVNPWIAPTIGFPPSTPPMPHFRPLHVWGHPSMDQSMVHIWPKHVAPMPPPPHAWPPTQPPPPADRAFWHPHHQHVPTPGTPCYPPHLQPTRFPTPPVPGIPPPGMFKVEPGHGVPNTVHHGKTMPKPACDIHPSKESVDAAIGDALSKPWLPLPLGLKPPSIDSVMGELQRQGVSKIPPATCAS